MHTAFIRRVNSVCFSLSLHSDGRVLCVQVPFLYIFPSLFLYLALFLSHQFHWFRCQTLLYGLKREHVHALALNRLPVRYTLIHVMYCIYILWDCLYSIVSFCVVYTFKFCWFSSSFFECFTGPTDIGGLNLMKIDISQKINCFCVCVRFQSEEEKIDSDKTRESVNFEWHCTSIFSFIYVFIRLFCYFFFLPQWLAVQYRAVVCVVACCLCDRIKRQWWWLFTTNFSLFFHFLLLILLLWRQWSRKKTRAHSIPPPTHAFSHTLTNEHLFR